MDVTAAVVVNQAQFQQTLAIAAMQQTAAAAQSVVAVLDASAEQLQPALNASSVPSGQTGQLLDILA
ncbi:MAG: hypothetical protein JXQ84_10325 [Rhodospirillaceae bacterium]|nr:hypothetical protein [Rhodospirillaceae bacterium]